MTESIATAPPAGTGPAAQQPHWPDAGQIHRVREFLAARPPLVGADDVDALRRELTRVAAGDAIVVQAGDCAEDPEESTADHVRRKTDLLDRLASAMHRASGLPVLRVGRIAGQFAKPRSCLSETVDGHRVPTYRGHIVNGPHPSARRPDPLRLLSCFMAASEIMMHLGWRDRPAGTPRSLGEPIVWTSHDSLLLDYERGLVRSDGERRWLGSTHWPWIGERTRQIDGAHVALLAGVGNPVAVKIGPDATRADVLALCECIDPDQLPGRLTLIARMGERAVRHALPPLVRAVRAAGFPAIWLCDPMHGNTRTTSAGRKFRVVDELVAEVRGFRAAVESGRGVAGGLHLETTPEPVTECVASAHEPTGPDYRTLCDPRLNPEQAVRVVEAWAG